MSVPLILALDTSNDACSAAICKANDIVAEQFAIAPRQQDALIANQVRGVLGAANCDVGALSAIAVSIGPGAFTGIRIGMGYALGIASGARLPVIGVPTLDALAAQTGNVASTLAGFDARMGELYLKLGDQPAALTTAAQARADFSPGAFALGLGSAFLAYPQLTDLVAGRVDAEARPRASEVATLAASGRYPPGPPQALEPLYLRDKVTA